MSLPLQIKTKESASNDELKFNVLTNLKLIDEWIDTRYEVRTDGRFANLISYGTSFRDNPEKIYDLPTGDIWCIKHTLPLFKDLDVKPKYCVLLDPRPADGVSTLGHVRRDLLEVYPETVYLVASMTNPSVTRALIEKGARVVGWHSACEAMKDPEVMARIQKWIIGGSCSAMRAISLAKIFGYRYVSLLGYDATIDEPEAYTNLVEEQVADLLAKNGVNVTCSSQFNEIMHGIFPVVEKYASDKFSNMLPPPTDENGNPVGSGHVRIIDNYVVDGKLEAMKLSIGDEVMWCTPELAAMAQDVENTFKSNTDMVFKNYSKGVTGALFKSMGGEEKINPQKFKSLHKK